jgi:hypothetical protein
MQPLMQGLQESGSFKAMNLWEKGIVLTARRGNSNAIGRYTVINPSDIVEVHFIVCKW